MRAGHKEIAANAIHEDLQEHGDVTAIFLLPQSRHKQQGPHVLVTKPAGQPDLSADFKDKLAIDVEGDDQP